MKGREKMRRGRKTEWKKREEGRNQVKEEGK
jgi:hypothetical protein